MDEGSLKLGSKNFQKKTNRWKVTLLQKKFIYENLVDKKTLKLKRELVIKRNCPCCKKNNNFLFIEKDFFKYLKCNSCSFIYVSPLIKEKELISIYKNSSYSNSWGKILSNKTEVKFNENKFLSLFKNINSFKKEKGKILDVGCATGHFLDICHKNDWETHGIELNDYERKIAIKKGHKVFKDKIELNYLKKNTYDVVSILEVLEHVYNPDKVIKSIKRILKNNGLLVVIVPNVDSLAANIMQGRCNMFLGMSHINMFDPTTLKSFIERYSFKEIYKTTITSELNVINNYLNMQDPYLGKELGKNDLIKQYNEKNIHKKLKGYKIKSIYKLVK